MKLATDTVVAWPLKPLARSAPPAHRVPAGEAVPGARVLIPAARADRPGWTMREVAQHAERHALQRQAHAAGYGFRVPGYVPTDRDLDLLESLFPECRVDGVPWEAIRAELECAPPGLIEPRNWAAATAPALLASCAAVRRALAADEDASRGIAEPETPQATPPAADRKPSKASEPRVVAGRLLLKAWKDYGEGAEKFPGYDALAEEGRRLFGVEIESHHFSRALKDLGERRDTIRRWIKPPKAMPGGRPQPAPTPGEIGECKAWFRNHPAAKADGVSDLLDSQSPEFWQHMTRSPNLWERAMQELVKEASAGIH